MSSQNLETDSSSCESKLREKHQNICEEAQQEEERDGEVRLCWSKNSSVYISSRGINLYVCVQDKAEDMCEVDNAGDRGMRRSEDGNKASKQSSEEEREGKHADTPRTEEISDPRHPSEESHGGKSQLQSLKLVIMVMAYDLIIASR